MAARFVPLRVAAFERLLFIWPEIIATPEERMTPLVASLRELAMLARAGDEAIACDRLIGYLHRTIAASPPLVLAGTLIEGRLR